MPFDPKRRLRETWLSGTQRALALRSALINISTPSKAVPAEWRRFSYRDGLISSYKRPTPAAAWRGRRRLGNSAGRETVLGQDECLLKDLPEPVPSVPAPHTS